MVGALKESFDSKESNWIKGSVQATANFEDGLHVPVVLEAIRKLSETKFWQRLQINSDSPSNYDQIMRFARMSTISVFMLCSCFCVPASRNFWFRVFAMRLRFPGCGFFLYNFVTAVKQLNDINQMLDFLLRLCNPLRIRI
uniref:Uncharacterized protein n=1 Tax=Glossina pallidipes TaxID=7398 RepID=A0A1B0AH50_GLOPL